MGDQEENIQNETTNGSTDIVKDTEMDTVEDFKIIGKVKKNRSSKVKPVLPKWMNQSTKFDGDIEKNSLDLEQYKSVINERIITTLNKNNIERLFPVQTTVIPHLINSLNNYKLAQQRDVCVLSPTGSGKTLAYAIPIVNHLINRIVTRIRVLVILPVSDLALQVYKVFQLLCNDTTLRVGLATSSCKKSESDAPMFHRKNIEGDYIPLVDILVATPGKLLDLIQRGDGFRLKHLEVLVIDEADRMINETQFHWLKEIEYCVFESTTKHPCPCFANGCSISGNFSNIDSLSPCSAFESFCLKKSLFKILFSATLSTDPEKMDNLSLYCPILFNNISPLVNSTLSDPKQTIPDNLRELMVIIDKDKKPLVIWHLIQDLKYSKILCFTDSIQSTHRLYQLTKRIPGIVVSEFSSNQNIQKRKKIMNKFQTGSIDMIISTDIFARGLDISGIGCVVCYDPPRNDTAYIHRIGRTARAGNQGTAISLITPDQLKHFTIVSRRAHKSDRKQIEKLSVKQSDLKHLIPQYKEALKLLEKDAKLEQKVGFFKKNNQIKKSKFSANNGRVTFGKTTK